METFPKHGNTPCCAFSCFLDQKNLNNIIWARHYNRRKSNTKTRGNYNLNWEGRRETAQEKKMSFKSFTYVNNEAKKDSGLHRIKCCMEPKSTDGTIRRMHRCMIIIMYNLTDKRINFQSRVRQNRETSADSHMPKKEDKSYRQGKKKSAKK